MNNTDDLALLLRILDPFERREEALGRIHADHVHAHVLGEGRHDLIALVQPQQAGVDEHAGQLRADGLVQQGRDDGGVDAARQAQHDLVRTDALPDLGDAVFDDVARGPQGAAAADLVDEALQDPAALAGMGDLRMELQAVQPALDIGHAGHRGRVGAGHQLEARRQLGNAVTVRHPHIQHAVAFGRRVVLDIAQQRRVASGPHLRIAELAMPGVLDDAAQLLGHGLHPIADAEHRDAQLEHGLGRARRLRIDHGLGSTGQHDPLRPEAPDLVAVDVPRVDLAKNAGLADPTGDQLGVLRAEIEDQDPVGVDIRAHEFAIRGCGPPLCGRPVVQTAGRSPSRSGNSGLPW
jgi:hypothetical protein